jgi:Signal transduction histidine kinase
LNKKLKRNTIIKTIIECLAYSTSLLLLTYLCYLYCKNKVWYPEDNLYYFLIAIQQFIIPILIFLIIVGSLAIIFYHFNKTFNYIDAILQAYDEIDKNDNQLIQIEYDELKEHETKINQVKLNLSNNKKAAKEAEQRKNDLIVYLAHDLKTPLTSIIGYMTLLKDEPQISESMREHYLSVVLEKSLRLEDLINEFFEITRFNLTHQELEYSTVNLTRLLEQLIFEFQPMFNQKNITCECQIPKDLMLKCDPNKMQRVFDNLLRNAVNYSFHNSTIHIDVKQDDKIHMTFLNQGNTIPKEKLGRLFEQFYRLDTSRTTSTGGAGLGLAIAKEIIEQHQGTIEAESYDEKVIFHITLPL